MPQCTPTQHNNKKFKKKVFQRETATFVNICQVREIFKEGLSYSRLLLLYRCSDLKGSDWLINWLVVLVLSRETN
jgi:hypothetical protein